MLIDRWLRRVLLYGLLVAFSLTFFQFTYSQAGTVVVKPGQFDHFTLQVPDRIIAGENFIIRAQAYDANKNLITNFSETGKEFKVDIQGSATVQPSVLSAASFSGGSANITLNSTKAGKFLFSLRESGGTVSVISRELFVRPNKLDHFELQAPTRVTAGSSFDVRIIAKDLFENTVDDLTVGRNIKFNSTGSSSVKMVGGTAVDFRNGMATASFLSEKAGNLFIELQEVSTGSRGHTPEISIAPSSLSSFKMQAPRMVTAGEAFDLLIAAYDAFDNVVSNYSSVGAGVRLSTNGTSKIEPSFISPAEFKNGQATIRIAYEKAEDIQIQAKESNREQAGKTADIQVSNTDPDHFVVVTPDSAVSGQKFKIKVETYDKFNNVVKNFNLVGNDVLLSVTGNGTITPSSLLPSEFINGVAMVDVMYDKAESFLISARMAADRTPGRISIKEQPERKEVPQTKEVQRVPDRQKSFAETVPQKPAAIREEPPKPAMTKTEKPAVQEPLAAKKAVPKPVKEAFIKEESARKVTAKEAKTAPEPTKITEVQKKTLPDKPAKAPVQEPDRKVAEKSSPIQEVRPKTTELKPEKKEPMTVREQKPPAVELARVEEKKIEKPSAPRLFSLSNISIIEAKNKAMLVINITNPNGHLEYSDVIESRYGKEWLKLRIKPAVRASDKLFKFRSAFVGDVMVEEDRAEQDTLNVFIEMIPSGITFDIARIKNTLVVTLSQP